MENISNITLGQIGTWLNHHWIQITIWIIAGDNILITAFTKAGWDTTFLQRVSIFFGSVLLQAGQKVIKPTAPVGPKSPAFPLILLCLCVALFSGCTSTMYKGGCATLQSSKNTVPYTFGTAGGTFLGCWFACIGNCKNEDFTPIKNEVSDYIKNAPKENSIKTSDGGTVTYTPVSK